MFSNSKTDKVAYFGVWADDARDRSFVIHNPMERAEAVTAAVATLMRQFPVKPRSS